MTIEKDYSNEEQVARDNTVSALTAAQEIARRLREDVKEPVTYEGAPCSGFALCILAGDRSLITGAHLSKRDVANVVSAFFALLVKQVGIVNAAKVAVSAIAENITDEQAAQLRASAEADSAEAFAAKVRKLNG